MAELTRVGDILGSFVEDLQARAERNAERADQLAGTKRLREERRLTAVPDDDQRVGLPPKVPARYAVGLDELEQTESVAAAALWWESTSPGLMLVGKPGRGKSAIGGALAMAAWPRCQYWPTRSLLRACRHDLDAAEGLLRRAATTDLLVLDDLGAERATDYAVDTLAGLIDDRYDAGYGRLVVVSNLAPDDADLEAHVGERAVSRLAEMCDVLPVTGPDRRRAA